MINVRNSGPAGSNGVTILACSGAADVGTFAGPDGAQACRRRGGEDALPGRRRRKVPAIMTKNLSASRRLMSNGCDRNCELTTLTQAGFPLYAHMNLVELGMEKGRTPVTTDAVEKVAAKGTELMAF